MSKKFFLVLLLLTSASTLFSMDPYDVMESLLGKKEHPRLLNSDDIPQLAPNDPQPLFAPVGDFNQDNLEDIAVSGVYDLPKTKNTYFLLIATKPPDKPQFKNLYFKTYEKPVYIHKPGSTGEADPGDQIFSISSCSNCGQGIDFYWNKKRNQFDLKPWTSKTIRGTKMVEVKEEEIPQQVIDEALRLVGELEDIKKYVADLNQREGSLGTRVEVGKKSKPQRIYNVKIFEKKESEEILYDQIGVDVINKKIVERKKKK